MALLPDKIKEQEIRFKVLKALYDNPRTNQRQLASELGVSFRIQ